LLRGSNYVFETITIPDREEEVRVLYAIISPVIILQVGQAMESYSRFLNAFKGIFIAIMTFLIVVAAGVGWFMARQAVSGVEAVTRTARNISEGNLEERVPVKPRGDEIDQLATTFNQMLDRIQTLLTEIKEMSDNIAHDLRSPITRIRGMAEVTLTTGKSLSEYENMAASTIEECDRLLDMINTMLMISKTESGVDKLSREEIDLGGWSGGM
jgi:signal transduction histidine kinase